MLVSLLIVALSLLKLSINILSTLLRMLNSLFDAGNFTANLIEPRLNFVKSIALIGIFVQRLDSTKCGLRNILISMILIDG